MTAIPEAKLAREAEIAYATIAGVTDYDVWKADSEVTLAEVLENAEQNQKAIKAAVEEAVRTLPDGLGATPTHRSKAPSTRLLKRSRRTPASASSRCWATTYKPSAGRRTPRTPRTPPNIGTAERREHDYTDSPPIFTHESRSTLTNSTGTPDT